MMNSNERIARAVEMERRVKKGDKNGGMALKRKKMLVLQKPKKEADRAVKMAETKNDVPIDQMKSSNKKITKMHTKVSPRSYFIKMLVSLVIAIIGGVMLCYTKDLICFLFISSGVGVFLIEFVDFEEAKYIEKEVGLENGKAEKRFLMTKSIVRLVRLINYNVKVFVRREQ